MNRKPFSLPKSLAAKKKRHFFVVDDHGEIISVGRLRGPFVAVLFLFLLAVVVAGSLLPLYRNAASESKRLQHHLDVARQRLKSLQADRDALLVRIVAAESLDDLKVLIRPCEKLPEDGNAAVVKPQPEGKEPLAQPETGKTTQVLRELPSADGGSVEADRIQKLRAESQRVAVENPLLTKGASAGVLRLTFKIKNSAPGKRISGTVVVILKPDDSAPDDWLVHPAVGLNSGKPARPGKGEEFSINNYKTMRFNLSGLRDPARFKKMAIFVYDTSGELICEKRFQIEFDAETFSFRVDEFSAG